MNDMTDFREARRSGTDERPLNLSRRGFLASAGALILSVNLPTARVSGQAETGVTARTRVSAFLEGRPDGAVLSRGPVIEGGQGIFTAMAQIVGEELDV